MKSALQASVKVYVYSNETLDVRLFVFQCLLVRTMFRMEMKLTWIVVVALAQFVQISKAVVSNPIVLAGFGHRASDKVSD